MSHFFFIKTLGGWLKNKLIITFHRREKLRPRKKAWKMIYSEVLWLDAIPGARILYSFHTPAPQCSPGGKKAHPGLAHTANETSLIFNTM